MIHQFHERLAFSETGERQKAVLERLRELLGGWGVEKASPEEDRQGTDYWIAGPHGRNFSVDLKVRGHCPIERNNSDDACIETCAIYRGPPQTPWREECRAVEGWTLDANKRTDLIVYTWPSGPDRIRYWAVYFPLLRAAARRYWRVWAQKYGELPARNPGYLTLNVFPPRGVILAAMESAAVGNISTAAPLPPVAQRAQARREQQSVGVDQTSFSF